MSQSVSFDRYRFEPATGRLWGDRRELKLTRKAAGVLGLLLERAGQPVTKQELFAAVWSGTVVSDDALTTCIQELRKALGTTPSSRGTSRRGIAMATASSRS
jgi:DNA-binding winged helix-turn-helix (wHTH) protein